LIVLVLGGSISVSAHKCVCVCAVSDFHDFALSRLWSWSPPPLVLVLGPVTGFRGVEPSCIQFTATGLAARSVVALLASLSAREPTDAGQISIFWPAVPRAPKLFQSPIL
jgi:hypothetical protein